MTAWKRKLPHDPVPILLESENQALVFFTKRDLLEEESGNVRDLWDLPEVLKILRKQQEDGSWKYPGKTVNIRTPEDYNQLETFRQLRFLVEMYGMTKEHPAFKQTAEYLFTCQTDEGDFRGIYGTQYAHTYSPGIMELLIKAGYAKDKRIEKGFSWLLRTRQDDGGWAAPVRTHNVKFEDVWDKPGPLQPVREKPFSHLMTGTVLRAFAAHPKRRNSEDAHKAGELLASRFFKADKYSDRRAPSFWIGFRFPFWFTNLLSALDSLSLIGFTPENPHIQKALDWFVDTQKKTGEWDLRILAGGKALNLKLWLSLGICRVFKRFYEK